MNKWFYRAVGTVGVAGGFLILAGGAVQADDVAPAQPAADPQQLRGLLDTFFTPTAGALPVQPVASGAPSSVAPALPSSLSPGLPTRSGDLTADRATDVAGNDLLLSGLLGGLPLGGGSPLGAPVAAPAESLPTDALTGLPLAGLPLADLPLADLPVDGLALPAADELSGNGPATAPAGDASALPVDGVEPVDSAGPLAALPLRSGSTGLPVRNDQLNADPAVGMLPPGVVPAGVRPTVQTGSVGAEVPMVGPVGADSHNGTAQVPALIGDTLAAQRADLFDATPPSESELPLLGSVPVLGNLTGALPGAAGSPAGLPARGLPAGLPGGLPGGLPVGMPKLPVGLPGGLPGLPTSALPTGTAGPRTLPVGAATARPPAPADAASDSAARPAAQTAAQAGRQVRHAAAHARPAGRHAAPAPGRHAAKPGRHAAGNRATAPNRRVTAPLQGRAAERPVAGEDVEFS